MFFLAGAKKIGVNPKINNMADAFNAARHNIVMISDSGLKSTCQSSFIRAHGGYDLKVLHPADTAMPRVMDGAAENKVITT